MTCARECADGRRARATIASSFSNVGIVDPLIEAAALQRVVDLARAVRRQDDERRLGGAHGAELGNRDLELGEQLEQVALELLVGAIDLVDQQDGRRDRRVDRLEQRPLDQERFAVQLAPRAARDRAPAAFEDAQLEQLPRVVPLVDGVADVEPLVALQADQIGVERRPAPRRARSCRRRPRLRETRTAKSVAAIKTFADVSINGNASPHDRIAVAAAVLDRLAFRTRTANSSPKTCTGMSVVRRQAAQRKRRDFLARSPLTPSA